MQHKNSVFHGLLNYLDWKEFDRLVEKYGGDHRVRRLSMKSQFIALMYGQLSGSHSLRDIETALASHEVRLYHVGAKLPARSTLADANSSRPWQVFAEFFERTMKQAHPGLRRKIAKQVRLIDSTKLKLSDLSADWARFSKNFSGAKLHIVYDPNESCPVTARITPDNVNDITAAQTLEIEPGATYVFDLAYYHFTWWQAFNEQGCHFVTRLKVNAKLSYDSDLPIKEGTDIVSDRLCHLAERISKGRPNPFQSPVREICLRRENGKILRFVTNNLKASAEEIAALYKQRWQIELFFKWIKQHLKIKHFLGTSENAVRIQIFVALIAYLVLKMAHKVNITVAQSALKFARLVRVNLMHLKLLDRLLHPEPSTIWDTRQAQLDLKPC
jgi:hypothetical protein